ncbi:hypothetical protein TRIUR3_26529 [Triticum urartu]|uniref:Uncharacterized protein n=1 Tax=Triticum urartu TaxID=4572 RepID=M8A143_TRIUA|nr:hypothetical protein TRIUR3_26529 [Triticum urartu]
MAQNDGYGYGYDGGRGKSDGGLTEVLDDKLGEVGGEPEGRRRWRDDDGRRRKKLTSSSMQRPALFRCPERTRPSARNLQDAPTRRRRRWPRQ